MPFVGVKIDEVLEKKRRSEPEFKKVWDDCREEYRLIGEMISLRREEKVTQGELA